MSHMRLGFDAGPQQTLMVPEVWVFLCHVLRDPSFCSRHARYLTSSRSLNPKERAKEKNQRHHRKERPGAKERGKFLNDNFHQSVWWFLLVICGFWILHEAFLLTIARPKEASVQAMGTTFTFYISVCPNPDTEWRVVLGMCMFVVRNQSVF